MSKINYEVIDNYLPKEEFEFIKNTMIDDKDPNFPWFFNWRVVYGPKGPKTEIDTIENWQFTHTFYRNHTPCSAYMNVISPIVEKLNPLAIMRIKANLRPASKDKIIFPYHLDFDGKLPGTKTAVYYVNTNNGTTIFDDGTEIESIENRMLIFDQNVVHTGTTTTDTKVRCLINLNYIDNV